MTKFKKNLDCLPQTNITDVNTNKNSHPMLLKTNTMDVGDKTKYQVSSNKYQPYLKRYLHPIRPSVLVIHKKMDLMWLMPHIFMRIFFMITKPPPRRPMSKNSQLLVTCWNRRITKNFWWSMHRILYNDHSHCFGHEKFLCVSQPPVRGGWGTFNRDCCHRLNSQQRLLTKSSLSDDTSRSVWQNGWVSAFYTVHTMCIMMITHNICMYILYLMI